MRQPLKGYKFYFPNEVAIRYPHLFPSLKVFKMLSSRPQEDQSFDPENARETKETERSQNLDVAVNVNGGTRTQVVDWDGPNDPQNPMNWSSTHKWAIIALVSTITFNTYAFYSRLN